MGAHEDELKRIAAARFEIPELGELRTALAVLQVTLKTVAESPGWQGKSAEAASQRMLTMRNKYFEIEQLADQLATSVTAANSAVTEAVEELNSLPGAKLPPGVHLTADAAGMVAFPGLGAIAAEGAMQAIEGFLGNKREDAAKAAVEAYAAKLEGPTSQASMARNQLTTIPWPVPKKIIDRSTDIDDGNTGGGVGSVGPTFSGRGGSAPNVGGPQSSFAPGYTDPGPTPDDGGPGLQPTGPTTGTPTIPSGGGGGLPVGSAPVLGGGIGAAGAVMGARLGGAGFGGGGASVGATPRLGTGGLLGSGAVATKGGGAGVAGGAGGVGGGAGSAGGAGGRSGAGGRGMAGGGAGAGAGDKKKQRPGVGLGGPIAPKLDDDEALAARAPGTRAGGRSDDASDDAAFDGAAFDDAVESGE